jgi:hypothetical protein
MTSHIYYVSWHTWLETEVHTPWDFWYLSKGTRPKTQSGAAHDAIADVWQKQDTHAWDKLMEHHVWDVKLAAFVQAHSESHAQSQVTQLFPDAEWDKCVQVDAVTKQQIEQLFGDTLKRAA